MSLKIIMETVTINKGHIITLRKGTFLSSLAEIISFRESSKINRIIAGTPSSAAGGEIQNTIDMIEYMQDPVIYLLLAYFII